MAHGLVHYIGPVAVDVGALPQRVSVGCVAVGELERLSANGNEGAPRGADESHVTVPERAAIHRRTLRRH